MRLLIPLLMLCGLTLAGCGEETASPATGGVVATTTQAADLARNITGGPVRSLIPPGADPHDHELRPEDVEALAEATLVVRSGGELDEWLDEAIRSAGGEPEVVDLLGAAGGGDPHWWHDPRAAIRAVEALGDAVGAAAARSRAERYVERIRALDTAIAACMRRVPEARRRLVTTHDALGPFARRYGITVVGTVIPSQSTQGQPSSGDVARLVRDIRRARVRTIFAESSVNPKVERAIAEQAGARVGRPLFSDALGPPGTGGDTYLRATAHNAAALAEGFSGGRVRCTLPS